MTAMMDQAAQLRMLAAAGASGGATDSSLPPPAPPDVTEAAETPQAPQAHAAPQPRPRAMVVAITSGKGGVGKSNVAVNLAIQLASAGRQVVLLDADLGL